MLKQLIPHSFVYAFLGASCLLCSNVYSDDPTSHGYPSQYSYPQQTYNNGNPGSSRYYSNKEELTYTNPQGTPDYRNQGYGTEGPLAQTDPYKTRSWDWDYKENWREDKDIFYSGGNQTNALQKDFHYQRPPGVGDPDDAYWLDPQYYRRPYYDYQRGYGRYPYYNQRDYNQNPYYYNQNYYNQRYWNTNRYSPNQGYNQNPYSSRQNYYYNPY